MIERPFWEFMMNLRAVKWFCSLKISKKVMQNSLAKKIFNCEMITYLFYGVMTTVINYIAYWLLCVALGVNLSAPSNADALPMNIANTAAFILALIFAFVTNKLIVFKSRNKGAVETFKEFVSFSAARVVTFFMELAILTVSTYIGLNLLIMKIIANIIVVILNYIFSKLFIFKNKE